VSLRLPYTSSDASRSSNASDEPEASGEAASEANELQARPVVLAARSMSMIRGIVGFVTLLIAFELRGGAQMSAAELLARNVARDLGHVMLRLDVTPIDQPPKWYFGVVVPLGVFGGLVGASIAPRLRRRIAEERMLAGSLALCGVAGVGALLLSGLAAYSILVVVVAAAASGGKQAFDSIIQRDAPVADRGRSFARFESRFQVAWVIGAVIPTAIHLPFEIGAAMVVAAAVATGFSYAGSGAPWRFRTPQPSRSGKSGISGRSSSSSS
jgi:hypothetical protein